MGEICEQADLPLFFMANYEIEILKAGNHVSSSGEPCSFGVNELKQVVESYDPNAFKAPLIVSHNTGGKADHDIVNSELAFGFPKELRLVGDRVKAVFEKISPQVVNWVREGRLLGISPSLYKPNSPSNPHPGKWSLRHIAALGKSPPAIKSLSPLALSEAIAVDEPSDSWAIALSEFEPSFSEEGTVDFMCGACAAEKSENQMEAVGTMASLFRRLREWMIGEFDMATADKVVAPEILDELTAPEDDEMDEAIATLTSLFRRVREWLIDQYDMETADKVVAPDLLDELLMPDDDDEEDDSSNYEMEGMKAQMADLQAQLNALMMPTPAVPPTSVSTDYNEERMSDTQTVEFMSAVGKLMKKNGIDAVAGAKATGIDQATLEGYMSGESEPSDSDAGAIAKALGVTKDEVMGMESAGKKKKEKSMDMSETDILNMQAELALLKAEKIRYEQEAIAAKQQARRVNIESFCESLVRNGRLLPAQTQELAIDFGEDDENLTLVDFMASLDERQEAFMREFLQSAPKQVEFGEIAKDDEAPVHPEVNFTSAEGYQVNPDRQREYEEILTYCEQKKWDHTPANLLKAALELQSTQRG